MTLTVTSCTDVALEKDVAHVTVEDATGSIGIRPGHAPLVTSLVQGIVIARGADGREDYVAVNGGVLVVNGESVRVASRQAVASSDLSHLEETVLKRFEEEDEADKTNHTAFERMRLDFMRRVVEFDQAGVAF